jgi:hypothetical protein
MSTTEATDRELPEQRIKHLEMVQAVIARLGNDSFLIKGWAITVVGVFLGLAVNSQKPLLALISIVPTLMFWGLDTYYLRSERLFRLFYERVRLGGEDYLPFSMEGTAPAFVDSLSGKDREIARWFKTAWRPTLRWLYIALVLAAVAVAIIAATVEQPDSDCSKRHTHLAGQIAKRC